ncbi:MAG: HAMP domain-containing histidine kinase [Nitrososphaeraceae archaeon]|nr:HAMP domain-containing histidine kinase [Nitrososphaeraceae archaeon]
MAFSSDKTGTGTTMVLHGSENVMNTIIQFLSKSNIIDSCGDSKAPKLTIELEEFRKLLFDLKKSGRKVRYITDITKNNIKYCKQLMDYFDEIRHIDGLRANFSVSDKEYLASGSLLQEETPRPQFTELLQQIIYSNVKDIVEQQKYVFESFWNKAMPAEQRIKQLEEGTILGNTEVIQIPSKIQELFIDLVKSAKEEVLLILPTINAFLREERLGIIQALKELAVAMNVKVRILSPINDVIEEKIHNILLFVNQGNKNTFIIQPIEITSKEITISTVTILVVDRKKSLAIDKTDDSKMDFIDAIGLATYSTSKPTVLSYVSIFESLSNQIKLYEQLKNHDKMQVEFINIASHELRTPTQAVLAYSELLQKHPEKREEMIKAINRNAERLQRLTNDILDVTRIESKTLKLQKEQFNLNDLLSNIVEDSKIEIEKNKRNVRLLLKAFKDINGSFLVMADKRRITQLISNLLNNAIKFTEGKGGDIHVTAEVKGEADGDGDNNYKEVVVSIKDTGTGIDPEIYPRLFTKFATKSEAGTGLGLFICKSIIEAHGGKIWAQNNKDDKGATFGFSLPVISNKEQC